MCILQRILRNPLKRESQSGVVSIEMALIAPVFLLILMGIIETSLMLLVQHMLENATFNASRLGKTGFVTAGETQSQTVTNVLMSELESVGGLIDTGHVVFTTSAFGDLSEIGGAGTEGLGTAQQVVVYTVTYPWKFFTPIIGQLMGDEKGEILLSARLVVRNEPYN